MKNFMKNGEMFFQKNILKTGKMFFGQETAADTKKQYW